MSPVAQAGKDFSYVLVILGGFAIAGFLLWSVGSEFFMSTSPQTIFAKTLKRVKSDPRVRKDAVTITKLEIQLAADHHLHMF